MFDHPWDGVFAATLCPFRDDLSIDEEGLRAYTRYLAAVPGMKGLVNNGHTGEVMGLHPCSVTENWEADLGIIKSWLDKENYCAVGEIGIDLYWEKSTLKFQKKAFRQQIEWAKENFCIWI